MRANQVEEMYERLVQWYSRNSLTPRREVERRVAEKVAQGKTREQAIRELYEEEERFYRELMTPRRREAPISKLQASLEPLRSAGSPEALYALFMFLMFVFVALAVFSAPIGAFPVAAFLVAAIVVPFLALLSSGASVSWKFEEEIVVEGAGGRLKDILEIVPKVFQALTLEEVTSSVEGNRLQLKVKLTRAITEGSQYGTRTVSVDLGSAVIDATLEPGDGNLLVRVSYSGQPPAEYASLAADEYEKLVVAFRSAVNEAWERVKPRPAIALDFTKLAELIASKGLVIAAIRCPYCGGSVDLPRGGDTVKCPYCGTTFKAVEVYEVIKKLVKELI